MSRAAPSSPAEPRSPPQSLVRAWAWWLSAPLVVAAGFGLIQAFPFGLMYDDGYFYAQIAYNLGTLGVSTFDGLHPTSGYHLAWGFVLAAVSWCVDLVTAERSAHLFAFLLTFAALAWALAGRISKRWAPRLAVLVLVAMATLLMDTLLLSLVLVALSRCLESGEPGGRRRWLADALVVAVPWIRIDATLIVVVHCVVLAIRGGSREAARRGGVLAVGVASQIGCMLFLFGEPFSVSAALKVSAGSFMGSVAESLTGVGGVVPGNVIRSLVFLGLLAAGVGAAWIGRRDERVLRRASLALGAVVFTAGHLVTHPIPFWCYLPAWILLFDLVLTTPAPAGGRWRALQRAVVFGLLAVGVVFLAHKVRLHVSGQEISRAARQFAAEVETRVPADEPIYQIDGSGFIAWYSQRHVINGDGLVNSHDYARRLRSGALVDYLEVEEICLLIDNRSPVAGRIVDHAGLLVTLEDVEEVVRTSGYGLFPTTDFVLYRLQAERCDGSLAGRQGAG